MGQSKTPRLDRGQDVTTTSSKRKEDRLEKERPPESDTSEGPQLVSTPN